MLNSHWCASRLPFSPFRHMSQYSKSVVSCNGKPPATVIRVLQQRKRQLARVSSQHSRMSNTVHSTVGTYILARQHGRLTLCRVVWAEQDKVEKLIAIPLPLTSVEGRHT